MFSINTCDLYVAVISVSLLHDQIVVRLPWLQARLLLWHGNYLTIKTPFGLTMRGRGKDLYLEFTNQHWAAPYLNLSPKIKLVVSRKSISKLLVELIKLEWLIFTKCILGRSRTL